MIRPSANTTSRFITFSLMVPYLVKKKEKKWQHQQIDVVRSHFCFLYFPVHLQCLISFEHNEFFAVWKHWIGLSGFTITISPNVGNKQISSFLLKLRCSFGGRVKQENLVLSHKLFKAELLLRKICKLMFQALAQHQSEWWSANTWNPNLLQG